MVFESGMSTDQDTLADFCQALKTIQARHSHVVQTMAQGVLELRDSHTVDNKTEMAIQYFLDRFYMSRISMRMLIHQARNMVINTSCLNISFSTHSCLSQMLTKTPKELA